MSDYFGDASYWLALVDENDQYHEVATQYSALLELENARIVTSQLVLNEVLAPRSGTTPERRQDTVGLVDQILRDLNVHVVPQLPEQFEEALLLLRARALDKEWSITDCASFLVMERSNIWEALTSSTTLNRPGSPRCCTDPGAPREVEATSLPRYAGNDGPEADLPQLPRRQPRPLRHRRQLGPGDVGLDLAAPG